jgi:phosphomannomutase
MLVLTHRQGAVVTNLSTSLVVEEAVTRSGSKLTRTPVGEVNVAVRMRELRAVVGGEGNGGVILPEVHLGRDAPVGIALILQLLTEVGKPLSAVAAELPRYAIVKDKLDRPNASLDSVYAALTKVFADATADAQDGLRLAWSDRWLHVRPSGTEPIVRVIAEAPTEQEARTLVQRARELLERLDAPARVGASSR